MDVKLKRNRTDDRRKPKPPRIADLKSYVIETNNAGFSYLNHGALHQLMQSKLPATQKE